MNIGSKSILMALNIQQETTVADSAAHSIMTATTGIAPALWKVHTKTYNERAVMSYNSTEDCSSFCTNGSLRRISYYLEQTNQQIDIVHISQIY